MKKYLPFIAVIVAIVVIAGIALANKNDSNPPNPAPSSSTTTPPPMTNMESSNTTPTPTPPPANESSTSSKVSITNYAYSPAELTVKKGTTVTWTNNDSVAHTVTVDSGDGPKSSLIAKGQTYSFKFDTVGTFAYHCEPHPYMHGKVIVTE